MVRARAATVGVPAPQMSGIECGTQKWKVVGGGVELGHDMAFQSVAHVVEVALNEIMQIGAGEDDSLYVVGGELVEIDDEPW